MHLRRSGRRARSPPGRLGPSSTRTAIKEAEESRNTTWGGIDTSVVPTAIAFYEPRASQGMQIKLEKLHLSPVQLHQLVVSAQRLLFLQLLLFLETSP